jgi:hypothetical protein
MLDDNDVFLLHASTGKVFLWIGRLSDPQEKREATTTAVKYIADHSLPANTQVERVSSGCETSSFKAEFATWDMPMRFDHTPRGNTGAGGQEVDVKSLLHRQPASEAMLDDGSGKLDLWVVKDFKKEVVPEANFGDFFGGDSYIALYTYGKARDQVIYFWLGDDSSRDEQGAAALLAVELDESLGGKPVQIRVVQGKEPTHFRALFKGAMVVYSGGHTRGAGMSEQEEVGLFHIRGTNAMNTMGVQVAANAGSLNGQDTFCLVTPSVVYVWHGQTANVHEITAATVIGNRLAGTYRGTGGRAVVSVAEGHEDEAFWTALGGKATYPSVAPGEAPPREPRLFCASTATGYFRVDEIDNFDQSDLNDEDVFLLDTYSQVYVWVGTQATKEEKDKAFEFASQYVTEASDGRGNVPVIRINAGNEPVMFTTHFLGWDKEYANKNTYKDPYQLTTQAVSRRCTITNPSP